MTQVSTLLEKFLREELEVMEAEKQQLKKQVDSLVQDIKRFYAKEHCDAILITCRSGEVRKEAFTILVEEGFFIKDETNDTFVVALRKNHTCLLEM